MSIQLLTHQYDFVMDTDTRYLALIGGYGTGKALHVDELVYTESGSSKIGNCKVGDQIYDHNGRLTTITGVFPQGKRKLYDVAFSDGTSVLADGDHLWNVIQTSRTQKGWIRNSVHSNKSEKRTYSITQKTLTTDKIREGLNEGIRHAIPLCEPVQFPQADIGIDRYTIGCILGDGNISGYAKVISTSDIEILNHFQSLYNVKHVGGYDYLIKSKSLAKDIKALGLRNTNSFTKFIPDVLKYDSIDNRFALLQGLMDTDGTVDKKGHCTFTSVGKQLADDVVWLARSLGFRSAIEYSRTPTYTYKGEKKLGAMAYTVRITGKYNHKLFRLPRKLERIKQTSSETITITSVAYNREDEAICIKVDNADHLFLTSTFKVTHNTFSFCYKAIHLASLNVGHTGALLEPINTMLHDVLIPEFEQALIECGIPYTYKASPLPQFVLRFATGKTTVIMRSAENYRRLAGLNLAFFGVDECDTINKDTAAKMWRMCQSRLREGKVYQGFTTSTPEGFGFLYEFFEKNRDKKDRRYIQAKTRDNPFLPEDFIQSLLDNYPPELIEAYLEGKFVNLTSGRVYHKFSRKDNHIDWTIDDVRNSVAGKKNIYGQQIPLPTLHIGMDFNVGKMAGIVHVIDDQGPIAIAEIADALDTEQMIAIIKDLYPEFNIAVYPDSSGGQRHTNNAGTSDLNMLRAAKFTVHVGNTNPPVKDRINSMNMAFCNVDGERRYRVNTNTCKAYTEALEQQVYDANGQPDKRHDKDHPNDAGGYFLFARYPVKQYKSGGLRMVGF